MKKRVGVLWLVFMFMSVAAWTQEIPQSAMDDADKGTGNGGDYIVQGESRELLDFNTGYCETFTSGKRLLLSNKKLHEVLIALGSHKATYRLAFDLRVVISNLQFCKFKGDLAILKDDRDLLKKEDNIERNARKLGSVVYYADKLGDIQADENGWLPIHEAVHELLPARVTALEHQTLVRSFDNRIREYLEGKRTDQSMDIFLSSFNLFEIKNYPIHSLIEGVYKRVANTEQTENRSYWNMLGEKARHDGKFDVSATRLPPYPSHGGNYTKFTVDIPKIAIQNWATSGYENLSNEDADWLTLQRSHDGKMLYSLSFDYKAVREEIGYESVKAFSSDPVPSAKTWARYALCGQFKSHAGVNLSWQPNEVDLVSQRGVLETPNYHRYHRFDEKRGKNNLHEIGLDLAKPNFDFNQPRYLASTAYSAFDTSKCSKAENDALKNIVWEIRANKENIIDRFDLCFATVFGNSDKYSAWLDLPMSCVTYELSKESPKDLVKQTGGWKVDTGRQM